MQFREEFIQFFFLFLARENPTSFVLESKQIIISAEFYIFSLSLRTSCHSLLKRNVFLLKTTETKGSMFIWLKQFANYSLTTAGHSHCWNAFDLSRCKKKAKKNEKKKLLMIQIQFGWFWFYLLFYLLNIHSRKENVALQNNGCYYEYNSIRTLDSIYFIHLLRNQIQTAKTKMPISSDLYNIKMFVYIGDRLQSAVVELDSLSAVPSHCIDFDWNESMSLILSLFFLLCGTCLISLPSTHIFCCKWKSTIKEEAEEE